MGGLSWWHWLVIGGAFILLFGAKKLPDAARGVGRSLRILKSEVSAMHEEHAAATSGAPGAAVTTSTSMPTSQPESTLSAAPVVAAAKASAARLG